MKKIILYICLCCIAPGVMASDTNDACADCPIYAGLSSDGYTQTVFELATPPTFFRKKDLEVALSYIQGSCCNQSCSTKKDCPNVLTKKTKYFAESSFMFDQLVLIGMKKLEGNKDHCDTLGITCHELGSKRYETITDIAESREGNPPAQIQLLYQKYRGKTPESYLTEKETLAYHYQAMCREAEYIYTNIGLNTTTKAALASVSEGGETRLQRCYNLVATRFLQQTEYVQTLQIEKGVQYYRNNIHAYISTYFAQNRGVTLLETFQTMNNCFTPVLKRIDRTVNCCMRGKE